MRKLRLSDYVLIIGFLLLGAGVVLNLKEMDELANYFLIAGAVVVIIRGFIRNHEK
ncbi:MAG: hypothetical protein IJ718_01225 [Paludibacteraceae bacterium]|jgi:hypothetical protein|nr:hypothetical protein [Paludibacteraceae bacterium]